MSQSYSQKGEKSNENKLNKHHKKNFNPLFLVWEDQEDDYVSTLDRSAGTVDCHDQNAAWMDHREPIECPNKAVD